MTRTKRIKALYTLIALANKAKDIREYRLANLTFGLAISILEDGEFELIYEDAGDSLSAYYDVVTIYLNDRGLSIPAPLLNKDGLVECLKKAKKVERLEHNRQFKDPSEKSLAIITSRYLKILREYFYIDNIENALWVLDIPNKREFEQWCFEFLCQEEIVSLVN